MKIKRAELIDVLALVAPGLSKKEVVQQSDTFCFLDGEVCTYNDEIAVSHPINLDVRGAVDAENLVRMLNKLDDEELEITDSEVELKIKAKRKKAAIRKQKEIKLPLEEMGQPKDDAWQDLPQDFCIGLRMCLFSASRDVARPDLTCVHIQNDMIETCDNFRFTQYTMEASAFADSTLISHTSMQELPKYEPFQYSFTPGWAHFISEKGTVFSCRVYQADYPDLSKFAKVQGAELTMPDGLKSALARAVILAEVEHDNKRIEIEIDKDGKMKIISGSGGGWYEERANVEYKGAGIKFNIDADAFSQMLDLNASIIVGDTSIKITGDAFIHVASLIIDE